MMEWWIWYSFFCLLASAKAKFGEKCGCRSESSKKSRGRGVEKTGFLLLKTPQKAEKTLKSVAAGCLFLMFIFLRVAFCGALCGIRCVCACPIQSRLCLC
jgi:hypothetical protein